MIGYLDLMGIFRSSNVIDISWRNGRLQIDTAYYGLIKACVL
jgi:hypothetical protein